jgi:carbamoyl-phosphate synthase large subunit
VKEAVFSRQVLGVDYYSWPRDEVHGRSDGRVGKTFGEAFVKSQLGAGTTPANRQGVLDRQNNDALNGRPSCSALKAMKFGPGGAFKGTASMIREAGIDCMTVNKVAEGRSHIVDYDQEQ